MELQVSDMVRCFDSTPNPNPQPYCDPNPDPADPGYVPLLREHAKRRRAVRRVLRRNGPRPCQGTSLLLLSLLLSLSAAMDHALWEGELLFWSGVVCALGPSDWMLDQQPRLIIIIDISGQAGYWNCLDQQPQVILFFCHRLNVRWDTGTAWTSSPSRRTPRSSRRRTSRRTSTACSTPCRRTSPCSEGRATASTAAACAPRSERSAASRWVGAGATSCAKQGDCRFAPCHGEKGAASDRPRGTMPLLTLVLTITLTLTVPEPN